MSGIFGYLTRNREEDGRRLRVLNRWTEVYGHEGCGEAAEDRFGIGCHVEHFLPEIPMPTPVWKRSGERYAAADTLLFNREELLPEGKRGISDEELLLDLYEKDGGKALRGVNGDFAAAIIDPKNDTVTLIRDQMGVRPLYIYYDRDTIAFSTDMRGLVSMPGADRSLEEKQFYIHTVGMNDLSLRRTEYARIFCVCPGSVTTLRMTRDGVNLQEKRYWKPGRKKVRLKNDEAYINRMRSLVEDAIKRRTDAMPGIIGSELSGGLDSGVIDILINRIGRKQTCVSWRIVPEDWPLVPGDERLVIKAICDAENLECEYTEPTDYERMSFRDPPEPPFANTFQLEKAGECVARHGARCVFTGQGGDEGVSHRCNIFELVRHGEYLSYLREISCGITNKPRLPRILWSGFLKVIRDYPARFKPYRQEEADASLLSEPFRERMKNVVGAPLLFAVDSVGGFENGGVRPRPETAAYLGANAGVRFLFPYEDYRVFDYAVSIPRRMYIRSGVGRYIYRKAFDDLMPQELREVTYKDFPSLRDKKLPAQLSPERGRKLLARLDRAMWSPYLDMQTLEKILDRTAPDEDDEEACSVFDDACNTVYYCLLLQRLTQQGESWALNESTDNKEE